VEPVRENAAADDHTDLTVLTLLLDGDRPALWSIAELGLELGDRLLASDAVERLHAAGLVNRCDQFAFASRSAARFSQLLDGI
jgi:hypothetical protein